MRVLKSNVLLIAVIVVIATNAAAQGRAVEATEVAASAEPRVPRQWF
jgi:hypothetical protein